MGSRRAAWSAIAAAAVMLAVGAVGPLGADGSDATTTSSVATAIEPLSPAGGARTIDQTIGALQSRLRDVPGDTRAAAQLGLAYLHKGRISLDPSYFPKAERLLRRAFEQDESNVDAMVGLGLVANARHAFAEGLRWGRRAAETNPYNAVARGVIVDALVELGRYDEAGTELQEMVDLKPDLASFSRVSYFRELNGDVPGAIDAMRMALDATPELGEDASWVYAQIGDLYFSIGKIAQARAAYEDGAAVASGYYLPQVGRARVAAARGDVSRAIEIMEKVVEAYPSPQNVIYLGDLYRASGRDADARDADALVGAQRRLFAAGGVIPDIELTLFYADRGLDPRRTIVLARRQYRARPSVRTADALAWALHAAGLDDRAARYSTEALRLGTKDALYLFHAGAIAAARGDDRRAERLLQAALDTNPYFSVIHAPAARRLLREVSR